MAAANPTPPPTAAPGPARGLQIRIVPRAGIKALVERLVASGVVEPPRAEEH